MKKILFAIILLSAKISIAQIAATNTGILHISGSTDILFAGNDFTNNAGSALTNNGQLYIQGNLANNQAAMATGTGTLYINGAAAQSVNGAATFRTFNFISNNAAGLTLNNNLSVSGAHTFSNGIITTSVTPNYLVYEAGSSYSGDGDASHVNGWVKKMGSTNFIFPVGNGIVERTVALSGLSGSSEFNAKYLANTPFTTQMQTPIYEIDPAEYWSINKVSGGTASVTLNWDYSKVYFPNWIIPDIRVAGYNGSLWVTNGGTASGTANTTGTITSNSISSFNLFAFGSQSYILPLNLIGFTAKRQDNFTQLAWTTVNEFNVSRFVVERSDDNAHFYAVGELPARNTGNTENYFSRDNSAINGIAYYRLRCIDIDGKEKISAIVRVTDGKTTNNLQLLTNPVRSKITLVATGQLAGEFEYQVSMINGQLVQKGKLPVLTSGQYEIPLNGKLQPGTYSLKVTSRMQSFHFKLLIL
ncbi:MAG: hypothetical protein ABI675_27700 [Chitinophagaceae bacterium]